VKQEKGIRKPIPYVLLALWVPFVVSSGLAADMNEFKVKREEVFEFAQKPVVAIDGDRVTIAFTSKAYCGVTVAIEDADSKIIRHLASGVLGKNAPGPFQQNLLKKTIVWDGKDDQGKYVDDKDSIIVRVSFGLKPQFEKSLYQSPYKRFGRNQPAFAPASQGVYVYGGDMVNTVRLFDYILAGGPLIGPERVQPKKK